MLSLKDRFSFHFFRPAQSDEGPDHRNHGDLVTHSSELGQFLLSEVHSGSCSTCSESPKATHSWVLPYRTPRVAPSRLGRYCLQEKWTSLTEACDMHVHFPPLQPFQAQCAFTRFCFGIASFTSHFHFSLLGPSVPLPSVNWPLLSSCSNLTSP